MPAHGVRPAVSANSNAARTREAAHVGLQLVAAGHPHRDSAAAEAPQLPLQHGGSRGVGAVPLSYQRCGSSK